MASGISTGAQSQTTGQHRTPAIFSTDAVAHGEGWHVSSASQVIPKGDGLEVQRGTRVDGGAVCDLKVAHHDHQHTTRRKAGKRNA